MDPTRFDFLTRGLVASQSRRGLLGGALGVLAGLLAAPESEAKHHRKAKNEQAKNEQRQGEAAKTKCRRAGHYCQGKQAETCCAGLACVASDRGSARRCTPCAAEGASCAGDEACCGRVCCRDELIDPVGTCCASRDRCCGSHCCTAGQACDQRFLMCVACTAEGGDLPEPRPLLRLLPRARSRLRRRALQVPAEDGDSLKSMDGPAPAALSMPEGLLEHRLKCGQRDILRRRSDHFRMPLRGTTAGCKNQLPRPSGRRCRQHPLAQAWHPN
jgi:hypothetical protein